MIVWCETKTKECPQGGKLCVNGKCLLASEKDKKNSLEQVIKNLQNKE